MKNTLLSRTFLAAFLLFLLPSGSPALILENLTPLQLFGLLKNKKVAYYLGSFDPIHRGHEAIVHHILAKKLVDFVLIYPAWGGDNYKVRSDVSVRLDMLFALYQDDPRVIVTRLEPGQLQEILTVSDSDTPSDKIGVKSRIPNVEYIGVIGSDNALQLAADVKKQARFLRGLKIMGTKLEEYKAHTLGCIVILPVARFIVPLRAGDKDKIGALGGHLGNRDFQTIHIKEEDTKSSTAARQAIQSNKPIEDHISPPVYKIIKKNSLYIARKF